jgi:hypothetical protein
MRIVLTVLFSVMAFCFLKAEDMERGFTFDLENPGQKQTLPTWMSGEPTASPAAHATISFPIVPPRDNSDLAVTFYFTETPGGFLRVYWAGAQTSEMLSDNLFEGIAMPNQRTLLIKRSTLSTPGTLNVQSSEATLNIARIHWEWVDSGTVSIADTTKQPALINGTGGVLGEDEVDGAPLLPKPDQIGKSVVTANLTDKPERIETGVEFVATLQGVPKYARLEVRMSGVPIDKSVQLWVNGVAAGSVQLEVPDLNDLGYQPATDGAPPAYIGWRKGFIYLPASELKTGDDEIQFVVKDAAAATPVAVKDLLLELNYDDSTSPAPAATPARTPQIIPTELTPPLTEQTPTPVETPPPPAQPTPSPVETSDPAGVDFVPF